jgi:hypothetical protein
MPLVSSCLVAVQPEDQRKTAARVAGARYPARGELLIHMMMATVLLTRTTTFYQ